MEDPSRRNERCVTALKQYEDAKLRRQTAFEHALGGSLHSDMATRPETQEIIEHWTQIVRDLFIPDRRAMLRRVHALRGGDLNPLELAIQSEDPSNKPALTEEKITQHGGKSKSWSTKEIKQNLDVDRRKVTKTDHLVPDLPILPQSSYQSTFPKCGDLKRARQWKTSLKYSAGKKGRAESYAQMSHNTLSSIEFIKQSE